METIQLLKQIIGIGPDTILHGDSDVLADWCARNKVSPQLLIATDLIEHVYDLSLFFKDLIHINDSMYLLFTTASTPFNPYVQQRLHKMMIGCESGSLESPNYYTLREQFITKLCPAFSPKEVETWARQTRGLTYPDIQKRSRKRVYQARKTHTILAIRLQVIGPNESFPYRLMRTYWHPTSSSLK